jgi:non-ribosomal peptide synthetase component F
MSLTPIPIDTLSLVDETERTQVVELFNQTQVATETVATTLPELFEQQVARTPEATALVFGATSLTYAALEARANQLARQLIRQGIGPEQIVALALPRSLEMVVALLAVLKSGAAYLPLDPDYPTARLSFMLSDSQASLLITQTGVIQDALDALQASASVLPVLALNDPATQATLERLDTAPITQTERLTALSTHNLAYLIYTSGSTGRPKGAGNTQAALINRLDWMQSALQLTPDDRVLQKHPGPLTSQSGSSYCHSFRVRP